MTSVLRPILTHDQRRLRSNSQHSFTPNRATGGHNYKNKFNKKFMNFFCKILIKRWPKRFDLNGNTVGFCIQISKVKKTKTSLSYGKLCSPFSEKNIEDPSTNINF